MALKSKFQKEQLAVEYSEEEGWSISNDQLNQYIKEHFEELHLAATNREGIEQKKFWVVMAMIAAIAVIIASLALAGAHIFAFILALVALADVKPILSFLNKSKE
jgi:hypothetical protein